MDENSVLGYSQLSLSVLVWLTNEKLTGCTGVFVIVVELNIYCNVLLVNFNLFISFRIFVAKINFDNL